MILKYLNKSFYINILIIFFIFCLDRISKQYVINLNNNNFGKELAISKNLNISLIWNEGIAFGLFSFDKSNLYNYLTVFIGLVILFLIYLALVTVNYKKYFLLLIIGGALGNFCDRVLYSAVPDFIDFHVGNFHWFTFNVADIFITLGVIFMILFEFTDNSKKQ
jgi:signal peptidase II